MARRSARCRLVWGVAALASVLAGAAPARAVQLGWERIELPAAGSYTLDFVPLSLDLTRPAPAVVFLHGYGVGPEAWQQQTNLAAMAEELGFVLLMPRAAADLNFGVGADDAVVDAALAAADQRLSIDHARVSLAGFSAGAAYALVLANARPGGFGGVFAMAAPWRPIVRLANPSHPPPVHFLYGTQDDNYPLQHEAWHEMLDRLGVANDLDLVAGLGHQVPPDANLRAGFAFLLAQPVPGCVPSETTLCLRRRFRVQARWETATGAGDAGVVQLTDESGYLWFFDRANVEVNVKLLDGCALNQRYWTFASGSTDVKVTLTVTDTLRQRTSTYVSPRGTPFQPVLDTDAFATCP